MHESMIKSLKGDLGYTGEKSSRFNKNSLEIVDPPLATFETFKLKLFTHSSLWYEKRGLSRDLPVQPVTSVPAHPSISFVKQLMATDSPFSTKRTMERLTSPDGFQVELTDADDGPTRAQQSLWSNIRRDARDRMEWEEYRQKLAGEYVPPATNRRMSSLFGQTEDDGTDTTIISDTQESDDGVISNNSNQEDNASNYNELTGTEIDSGAVEPGTPKGILNREKQTVEKLESSASPQPKIPSTISSTDVDAAIRYLSSGREYTLADRANMAYLWSVTVQQSKQGLHSDKKMNAMTLQWKNIRDHSSHALPVGNVDLSDLKNITYDAIGKLSSTSAVGKGLTITLHLKNSTRALKSCGGRTKLVMKGIQVQDTKKYHMCLRNLWLVVSGQSKMVNSDYVDIDGNSVEEN